MNRIALALFALLCLVPRPASAQTPRLVKSSGKSYLALGKDRLPLDNKPPTPKPTPWLRLATGASVRLLPNGDVQALSLSTLR